MDVVLSNGKHRAHFLPDKGMNLISLCLQEHELIDQSTLPLFEARYAGLGAMIGPHFHHRSADQITCFPSETLFPHLSITKAKGMQEPFSHGIGRYAPWRVVSCSKTDLTCELAGKDQWNGFALAQLEGQDFHMSYSATLTELGLQLHLQVQSEKPSIVGLHTYYSLDQLPSVVLAKVQDHYNDMGTFKPMDSTWNYHDSTLTFPLPQEADFGFVAYPNPAEGEILLKNDKKTVCIHYWSDGAQSSWQLWHPKGASFVCIEPLSAKNPRKCYLKESSIKILISLQ